MKTTYEWIEYFDKKYPGDNMNIPCGMEQAYRHSYKEKYCADCGSTENLILKPGGVWINEKHYFCNDCETYWNNKK